MTKPDSTKKRRVAVVGGGIIGLCLSEALAERGVSHWCFEKGTIGSGQSGGVTRIFRHRHEEPDLVRLALRARSNWTDLEERLEKQLVGDEGVLILTTADEAARFEQLGVSVQSPSWEDAAAMVHLGRPAGGEPYFLFEPNGGAIRAQVAMRALHQAVEPSIVDAEVLGIAQDSSGVTVFASNGIYSVDEVFVTAGAGTARLAKAEGVEIPERRACHLRLTFESSAPQAFPCLLDRSNHFGETAYGSPTPDGRGYAIGISSDDGSVPTRASEVPDTSRLSQIQSRIEAYAGRLSPTALGTVTGARVCLATPLHSGDDDFSAWRKGRATYFAGHNLFKFAPTIGALLAESIDGQDLPQDLNPSN